ncbi:MAG: hypothetical protein IPM48_12200 [Saprospiraceae bacterium]|nr:hypothetical protein [Saprospiraceae bacterium]
MDLLRFGHGGGVLGKEYVFFLKTDGTIWDQSGLNVKLSSNQLKQVLKNIEFAKLRDSRYNQPGNLYQFVEIENTQKEWTRIAWDPNSPYLPDKYSLFYNFMYHFLKS